MVGKEEPSYINGGNGGQPTTVPLRENLRVGLATLLQAYTYAQDANVEPWEFALEISELYRTGLVISDLRWLVAKGLVKHGEETSGFGDSHRSFCLRGGLNFRPATCFILTRRGAAFAENVAIDTTSSSTALITESKTAVPQTLFSVADEAGEPPPVQKPHWDEGRRELWMTGKIVKRFRVPARNQELILCSFEEEGWPRHILDPCRPAATPIPPRGCTTLSFDSTGARSIPCCASTEMATRTVSCGSRSLKALWWRRKCRNPFPKTFLLPH